MDHFLGKVNTSIATYWWVMIGLLQLMKITFQHWNHRTFPKSTEKCIKSVLFLCEEAYVIVACSNKNTSRSAKLSISLCIDWSISCMHANMQISVYLVDLLFRDHSRPRRFTICFFPIICKILQLLLWFFSGKWPSMQGYCEKNLRKFRKG
jgi:hypothetical protein